MKETEKVLKEWAPIFEDVYKRKLEQSEDTGALINSISVSTKVNGNDFIISMTLEDYWKYIEYGRQPGSFPPVDKLVSWVERKIPNPNPIPSQNNRIPTPNQIAYLVGRKIFEQGIEAKPYLQETIDEIKDVFIDDLKVALAEDIKNEIFS